VLSVQEPLVADPVLLITGASSGIGAATARRASASGYRVTLAGRDPEALATLALQLGGPDRTLAVATEVSDWDDQRRAVERTLDHFGRLDVAFANAGLSTDRGFLASTPERWREMVLTNVLGVAYTIRATLPALRETAGHFVATSSSVARQVSPGSLYSATKHAVTAMAESLRLEVGGAIRVTVIEPGAVDTPIYDPRPSPALDADDIAQTVLYAISQPPGVDVNQIVIRPPGQTS
jgi:NADP-dependent 3-hydroxy acid dehydrogenase YdfG